MNNSNKINALIMQLMDIIDREMNETDEQRQARYEAEVARRRVRIAHKNERFANALCKATDMQAARMSKLIDDGMTVSKIWTSRTNGRICVMLQKEGVWNQATGRISCKLAMVYHDGRYQESFGKIAIQNDWI